MMDGMIKIKQIFGVIYLIKTIAQGIKIGKSVMEQLHVVMVVTQ